MVEIKLREENFYGKKKMKLDMTNKEIEELSLQQLGCLMAIGISGDDYKRVHVVYARKKLAKKGGT